MTEVLGMIVSVDTTLQVWFSLEEHPLPNAKEKESIHLKTIYFWKNDLCPLKICQEILVPT